LSGQRRPTAKVALPRRRRLVAAAALARDMSALGGDKGVAARTPRAARAGACAA